mmetsp:Transcript_28143/g.50311  ORF Transcript_28143/g.50311 Transcript_28143/m.50311 type:complete len:477 (-) Transcript_28143:220-1650(-)|eukprot:CAMPEP_0177763244 /NCGR_PEP_ID=MMETSP0491_2-20121128/6770_1 /TAXON_ID=63592 /ORGANISM="Tetraselmis chuii, Strain PLY429" /LENGTH=476 /DNA_ID=CAMNT_0019279343 /DNA_START=334 /DNA_END=1764 /DNA_ORIENTATION=-
MQSRDENCESVLLPSVTSRVGLASIGAGLLTFLRAVGISGSVDTLGSKIPERLGLTLTLRGSLVTSTGFAILAGLLHLFPISSSVVFSTVAALWLYYRRRLCIRPSSRPRRSPFTDTVQRALSFPPPYPNGWYHLVTTSDVGRGEVVQAEALGRKFAVWRAADGELSVLDAFCPHGGANLCGGRVVGGSLQCPFHLWEFNTKGGVTKVPWLDAPPKTVTSAKNWPHVDWHGMICIWFDAEGRPPMFDIPPVAPIAKGDMRLCGRWEVDRPIYMHLSDFMENTVDVQHFSPMHGQMAIPWTEVKIPGVHVVFDSKVVLGSDGEAGELGLFPNTGEFLYFLNDSSLTFLGRPVPKTTAHVAVQFIGPALHRFIFTIPDLGRIVMIQTHLPLLENRGLAQRVRFAWFADTAIPSALASYVVGEWVSNWWEDVHVWEEKIRRAKPGLVRGDGPINRGRRWFRQFYSESSESVGRPISFDW